MYFEQTGVWKRSLAQQENEEKFSADARNRLREGFLRMRDRTRDLVNQIHADLRQFTVHDITHLDALWELADLIAGPDYPLTPTEAFVLGGSFLCHDAGMSLAAYPKGLADIKARLSLGCSIELTEQSRDSQHNISDPLLATAIQEFLRANHAAHARALPLQVWTINEHSLFLIEDAALRENYGHYIGQVSYSHCCDMEYVRQHFRNIGSATFCPPEWTVDLLKVACLLRVADASHIDERRAPTWLRALRNPQQEADLHWQFQNRLMRPHVEGSALRYTTKRPFEPKEIPAWWLCHKTLKMINEELHSVDTVLADTGRQRFLVNHVFNIQTPGRLSTDIQAIGWAPDPAPGAFMPPLPWPAPDPAPPLGDPSRIQSGSTKTTDDALRILEEDSVKARSLEASANWFMANVTHLKTFKDLNSLCRDHQHFSEFTPEAADILSRFERLNDSIMRGELDLGSQENIRQKINFDYDTLITRMRKKTHTEHIARSEGVRHSLLQAQVLLRTALHAAENYLTSGKNDEDKSDLFTAVQERLWNDYKELFSLIFTN